MSISVVIPTLNRHTQLLDLLNRLAKVELGEEIVIVDDSKESMEAELNGRFSFPIIYVNRGEKLGVSSARNVGASKATRPYLLFLDDDDDFEKNWLCDFRKSLETKPDLVFCNMLRVDPDGRMRLVKVSDSQFGAMGNRIVIPGAWVIMRELFEALSGYDERLLFAENTEFFIRAFARKPTVEFVEGHNFIYHPCPTGGSKNLQNMVDSLTIILDKHRDTLSGHVKHLYHQIIGVNEMRFRNFSQARYHLWKSIQFKPTKMATWARFSLACMPFLAKRLYSETVTHD